MSLAKVKSALRVWGRGRRDDAVTIGLTALFVSVTTAVHYLVRYLEHRSIKSTSVTDIAIELGLVAAPVIFYARRVIASLKRSRRELAEMSRRLAIAAEQAEESSRAKSTFLANMSHELRTPLNAILGFSEIMKDQHLGPVHNPRYLGYAGDIHDSGRHLLGIINDILDLAKIESGKMSLDAACEFEAGPSIGAALSMVTGLGEKYGVRVVADLPKDGVRLVAVERMVRQIVINLAGNAIKFTPEGGAVHVAGTLAGDGGYCLAVRDTGVGMSESEIACALMPFGQNATKMGAKHDGTGLGLPLAKAMLELHGGTLAISSRPDHGTIVTVTFPPERVIRAEREAA